VGWEQDITVKGVNKNISSRHSVKPNK